MKDCLDYFLRAVETNPNGVAVIDGAQSISYANFHSLMLSMARGLYTYGAKPKVAFELEQGIDAYALEIAVLYVGGVFCPLNVGAPHDRKDLMVAEFGASTVVVREQPDDGRYAGYNPISLDTLKKNGVGGDWHLATPNVDDSAYVIFTSGSTGKPKGVEILRRGLNKFLEWSIPTYSATTGDRWGQFSLLSFDLSIVDIFTCLGSGATLVTFSDPSSKLRPSSLIEKNGITIWHSIPSVVDLMISRNASKPINLSTVRLMSYCGEPLKRHHLDFIFSKNPAVKVLNTYGPTEGTLFCTWQELTAYDYTTYSGATASIGKAIPGWSLSLEPNSDFGLLDIVIYGEYIGKGYLSSVDASGFMVKEIAGLKEGTFATGDLAELTAGNLYFQGRKDRQVKRNGYRVELGEIDFWITDFLKVASATVLVKAGFVTFIETNETISEVELRNWLSGKLEAYKMPTKFIGMPSLPRNDNMKIDHSKLMHYEL